MKYYTSINLATQELFADVQWDKINFLEELIEQTENTKSELVEQLLAGPRSVLKKNLPFSRHPSYAEFLASETIGIVSAFKDSVVTIVGLRSAKVNELVIFQSQLTGVVLNLEYGLVKVLILASAKSIGVNSIVYCTGMVVRVGVGPAVLGRVVNPIGRAIDGLGALKFNKFRNIEQKAPGVITRKKIVESLETGLKVVDCLVPIGRGQRELILGDRKTGKTTIAVDTILNQLNSLKKFERFVFCVYVAIGKRLTEVVRINRLLSSRGMINYTAIIAARASDPASLQFIAPYSACTMAEYFTYNGQHSLIIYDDLSKHADAYRQLSLLLRRPVGREAYPGDIFYLHSRLLERAVKLNVSLGAGSLTALPIVETIQGDVSAYIPTNVISITDGQIYLDLNRHQEGVRPAVDPGISVSRVGSSAQAKLMKALGGTLKLELAQFREIEQFSKFGSELDAATRKLLLKGQVMVEILKQERNAPIALYKQIALLFVTTTSFFEELITDPLFDLREYTSSLFFFLENSVFFRPFRLTLEVEKNTKKVLSSLNFLILLHYNYFYSSNFRKLVSSSESEVEFRWNNANFNAWFFGSSNKDSALKESSSLHTAIIDTKQAYTQANAFFRATLELNGSLEKVWKAKNRSAWADNLLVMNLFKVLFVFKASKTLNGFAAHWNQTSSANVNSVCHLLFSGANSELKLLSSLRQLGKSLL